MFQFLDLAALRVCIARDWTPQIGDPDITGWLTVLSYLICFALGCTVLYRQPHGMARGLWISITAITAFLALNKQLDLQTALTATGRCLSHAQGWYDNRRYVQLAFILGLIIAVLIGMIATVMALSGKLRSNAIAVAGLAILCCFVLVRAVGFHHIDRLISMDFANIKFNFLFENIGLLLIAVNAVMLLRRPR